MAYDKKVALGKPRTAHAVNSLRLPSYIAVRIISALYRLVPWLSASGVFNA